MAHDLTIPAVGESVSEGVIARWLVEDGSYVAEGTPIYELETDKISTEVEAEVGGVISLVAAEGDELEVGAVVARLDTEASPPKADDSPKPDDRSRSPAEVQAEKAAAGHTAADDDEDTHFTPREVERAAVAEEPESGPPSMSPAVRRLVAEHDLDPARIPATGKNGRLVKADVLAYLDDRPAAEPRKEEPPAPPAPRSPQPEAPAPKPSVPDADAGDGTRRTRMSTLRKRIAQRLINAQRTAAILTTFNEVDMSAVMDIRSRYKEEFAQKHDTRLGLMSFFVKAACEALRRYPLINAQIDGDDLLEFDGMHIGVAVGTPKGLVVPVLRHAQDMGFAAIERTIRDFAARAQEGKLAIDDMTGGSFTISNGGTYGSMMSTPILNPPQSGILGMHSISDRPVAIDGAVAIRPMMYVALSYDHRIVDGAEAVGFLVHLKRCLEAPERMLFDL